MKVVCDVETDDLYDPKHIWVIVCREVDTGSVHVFRNITDDPTPFREYARKVSRWIGHNFLGFDAIVLNRLLGDGTIDYLLVTDTLVLSKLFNFRMQGGHSLEAWGERFGYPKSLFSDFSRWSPELEERCIKDVELTHKLYDLFLPYLSSSSWESSISIEHKMVLISKDMNLDGFQFNLPKAKELHTKIAAQLEQVDEELRDAFPPRSYLVREICPRATKHGTLHRGDFRFLGSSDVADLSPFSVGASFSTFKWRDFNPGSVAQINERLEGFWDPVERTKGETLWKANETNFETLREDAPKAAQKLVQRFLLKKRLTTLEEWFKAVREAPGGSWRVHGNINHIGAWTHRCSHDNPNMGNVPSLFSKYQDKKLKELAYEIGVQFRSLWEADTGFSLVGCDADGIQLRIFAHYINDPEFTAALVSGDKDAGTDAHSLNAKALGERVSRDQAKTFIYAFLLGAGVAKVSKILSCPMGEAKECVARFVARYPGLKYLREELIPRDIARGYFDGFDGRKVIIPKTEGNMMGYVLGGYLQNGEACIMKHANLLWRKELREKGIYFKQVNFVHDEWQTVCSLDDAPRVGETQARSIESIARAFNLNCPFAGNFKIGSNWYETH